MKLSTKTRYGARAMLDLALHYEESLVSVRELAAHQQLSRKYLEHLLATLRSAGLVRSVRGAQGGHTLTRPPAQEDAVGPLVGVDGGLGSPSTLNSRASGQRPAANTISRLSAVQARPHAPFRSSIWATSRGRPRRGMWPRG